MYQKILVPLDGSKRAEAILSHVESIAKSNHAKVIFPQGRGGARYAGT